MLHPSVRCITSLYSVLGGYSPSFCYVASIWASRYGDLLAPHIQNIWISIKVAGRSTFYVHIYSFLSISVLILQCNFHCYEFYSAQFQCCLMFQFPDYRSSGICSLSRTVSPSVSVSTMLIGIVGTNSWLFLHWFLLCEDYSHKHSSNMKKKWYDTDLSLSLPLCLPYDICYACLRRFECFNICFLG